MRARKWDINLGVKDGVLAGLLILCGLSLHAQTTKISGKVYDATTKEPLPFVNISFQDSKIGTSTDIDGNYSIETYYATDSIQASFVGYHKMTLKVRKDHSQRIDFPLQSSDTELEEVVIVYQKEENPAHPIIRSTIKNKKINNREKLEAYEYEVYNKVEFDLNNIDEKFKNRKVFKPFKFVWDGIDTTDDKDYLPVFLTESLSDFYYRKSPKTQREVIKATKVSGTDNESVQQFLGDMYTNFNVYDNNLHIFGKNFVSPVANFGFAYYRYYLMDSAFIGSDWCYKIRFQPKRKQEPCFIGDMWINDTTYAIRKIEADIAKDANINWVNELHVLQEFNEVEHEVWMLTKEQTIADLNVTDKSMGFYGRRTATYKDFVINKPRENEFYSGPTNIIVADDANEKTEEFWNEARHDTLSANEQFVYHMSDTMTQIPQFRTYVDVLTIIFTGYKIWGPLEIGPYASMYSNNPVEGHRFRLGGRTSNAFSTRLMIEGYGAYGLRDQDFKYGGGFKYFLGKKPRHHVGVYYKDDVEQLGASENAYSNDNVLAAFLRRNRRAPWNLTRVEEFKGYYDREWFEGLSNQLMFRRRRIHPLGGFEFDHINTDGDLEYINHITNSELIFYTRWAHGEKFLAGEFERISLGTKAPVLAFQLSLGLKDFWGGEYDYKKARVSVEDNFYVGVFGYTKYQAEVGKIWGTLPYPLLEMHSGNQTYYYYEHAFNTMNFFEFMSDEWVSGRVEHHFGGFFLNRIPLFRKLKWREVVAFKGVYGRLNPKHLEELTLGRNMYNLYDGPFLEGAVGVENILKVLRVDLLYRASYLDHPDIAKLGIRAKLHIDF